jgi:hypothetical protein
MSFFENILNFITDSEKRLSARATVFIISIFTLFLVDNLTGLSFYYNNQRQLEQLKLITELASDTTLTKETKVKLLKLQNETLERKNIIDYSSSFLKNITLMSSKQTQKTKNIPTKSIRNNVWFLISSSGLYILVTIFVVPVLLLTDKKTPFLKLLASMIVFVLVMFFTSWFNYWLFEKIIPNEIFGSWTWNYIINFVMQIGLIIGLVFATNTMNKINASHQQPF